MTSPLSGADLVQVVVLTAAAVIAFVPIVRVLIASVHALQQDDY